MYQHSGIRTIDEQWRHNREMWLKLFNSFILNISFYVQILSAFDTLLQHSECRALPPTTQSRYSISLAMNMISVPP